MPAEIEIGGLTFPLEPSGPRCGIHGLPIEEKRCVACDAGLGSDSLASSQRKARLAFDAFGGSEPISFRDGSLRWLLGPDLIPFEIEPIPEEER